MFGGLCTSFAVFCVYAIAEFSSVSGDVIHSHHGDEHLHSNSLPPHGDDPRPNDNHPPADFGDLRFHLIRNGMIEYAIHRGCRYMSGFVRSHYVHDEKDDDKRFLLSQPHPPGPPGPSDHDCEWQQFVDHMCATFDIPRELHDAIIDCGMPYTVNSFGHLHASADMMHSCNMTNFDAPAAVGKRREAYSAYLSGTKDIVLRDRPDSGHDDDGHDDDNNDDVIDDSPHGRFDWPRIQTDVDNNTAVRSWCQKFSWNIKEHHRFNGKHSIKPTNYWILDVYRTINKHRMPQYYAHCLVGCGMKYAMFAFRVPLWQTLAYMLRLN